MLLRRREQFRSLLGRAALLIGLAAGPGCAGDDGLSRTAFRARADSICASANDEIRALGPEPPILTDEQAAWVEGVGAVGKAAVERSAAWHGPRATVSALTS